MIFAFALHGAKKQHGRFLTASVGSEDERGNCSDNGGGHSCCRHRAIGATGTLDDLSGLGESEHFDGRDERSNVVASDDTWAIKAWIPSDLLISGGQVELAHPIASGTRSCFSAVWVIKIFNHR